MSLMDFTRLLLPLDGSERAETVLPLARSCAETLVCRVVEHHASAAPGVAAGLGLALCEARREQHDEEGARGYLAQVAQELRAHGLAVQTLLLHGDPSEEILRVAEEQQVDLIAMASHGHGGPKRWLLGSVADSVVRRAPCPVLIFPPGSQERRFSARGRSSAPSV